MKRTEIARIFADMEHFDGQDVTVCGWTCTCLLYTSPSPRDRG